mgnify:CR=1 FL=1
MKTKTKFFLIILILLLITGGFYFINPLVNSSNKNLENETAALRLNALDLVENYTNNEENSNDLYAGKIIEVTGNIKEISFLNERITVILNSNSETFGVICDINPNQKEKINQLQKNQKIQIKGICKGFLKDVILLNCTIDLLTNE